MALFAASHVRDGGPVRSEFQRHRTAAQALRSFLTALVALFGSACASIPLGAAAVNSVTVEGNREIASSDIEEKIATAPSAKFLGLFRGLVFDYEIFDRSVLQQDLERVERYYRSRGYYEAHARAGRVVYTASDHVEITIEVEEGPCVLVHDVHVDGLGALTPKQAAVIHAVVTSTLGKGGAFEEDPFEEAARAMTRALTDRGYAWAKVEHRADVDLPKHQANLYFTATPGPKATFGKITVEGLKELPKATVVRTVDIEPGQPYSTARIDRARQAVLALGTFGTVEITPMLDDPPPSDAVVPLRVRVQEQKLRSVLLGGGIELDAIRAQVHLHFGWEDKNLFGGFRHLSLDLKPGLDFYPTRLPDFQAPNAYLVEERFTASFRQPSFVEARTTGVVTQELNTYPVLLSPKVDPKAPVLGYLEYKGAVGLERTLWKMFASPTYNFQYNLPFAYRGKLDSDLRGVIISYVELIGRLDLRDDRLRPHAGVYLQDDFQFAGIGGDARDFRMQPEIRGYVPLGKKVTIAARGTIGFLFPLNYGDAAAAAAGRDPGAVDRAAWTQDVELIYLRGFFSGGPSSNRGYPIGGVGPHGTVPFFNPGLAAKALAAACDLSSPTFSQVQCAVPLGGLSLWEASLELRFPLVGPLSGAAFCDTSDVAAKRFTVRLNYPHLSCGLGFRYDTPIGPIRIDAGYRIPGAQIPGSVDPRTEGDPGTVFGAPIAFAFGLGESF